MDGFEAYEHLFIGQDPLAIARHVRALETIDFHAGRFWPLEVALWDIIGQVAGTAGGDAVRRRARRACPCTPRAGCCWRPRRAPRPRCACGRRGSARSRSGSTRATSRRGIAAVAATRAAVGDTMAIMVDLNQGWRMPGDTTRSVDPVTAREIAVRLAELDVLWLEEPLAGTDLPGLAALRASAPGVRIAGGEMTRTFVELLAALDADAFDVHQPDVVLAAGMLRSRTVAEVAIARNRWFTPHTWTNGIGLAGQPARGGRGRWRAVPRVPLRPARLDPGAPRLHARRADPARTRRHPARPDRAGPRDRARRRRDPAVRRMTATDPGRRRTGSRAPPPSRRGPRRSSTAGSSPRPRAGSFDDIAGRDGSVIAQVAEGDVEDVDRAVARRQALVRRPTLVRPAAGGPQARPAAARRADPRQPRRAGAARVARRRQADPRHARGRRPERRDDASSGTPRPSTRRTARSGRPVPTRSSLVTREPHRGGRRDRALELPADHHGLEARGRARDGQLGRPQARLAVAADGPPARRAGRPRPGCPTGSSTSSRVRAPSLGRALARHPDVDKIAFTGLDRGGRSLLREIGETEPQGHHAGARRQEPAGRLRGRRRPRRGRLGDRVGDLLQQRPDLQRGLAAHRPSVHPRGAGRADRGAGADARARASRSTRATQLGPIVDARQLEKVLGLRRPRPEEGRPRRGRRSSASARRRAASTSRRRSSTASTTRGGSPARRSSGRS